MRKNQWTLLRLLALVLMVGLCLVGAVACHDDTPDGPPDGPQDEDTGNGPERVWPDDGETVNIENLAEYTIIRSESAEPDVRLEVSTLYSLLSARFKGIKIGTDYTKEQTPIANTAYEVLVGRTNRVETAEAIDAAVAAAGDDENWYHVSVRGNKIVIVGSDEENTLIAIRYFINRYVVASGTALEVPLDMSRTYVQNEPAVITTLQGEVYVTIANLLREPYFADRTGEQDVTYVVQGAIDDVAALGGGVVYLPAGTYRLSEQLKIPSYVTLLGDYVDPDKGDFANGTVLLFDKKGDYKNTSAILVDECGAVEGLTFYYENQSVRTPIQYEPTVQSSGSMVTVRDCTFINSYYAIFTGANAKGMLTVDNVKGTALWRGLDNNNSADICVTTDVHFSPKYWASAGEAFGAPAEADIRALMKTNGSIGFTLGDCDRDTYENIMLDGFATGIYNRAPQRAGLCGSYYNIVITDVKIGMDLRGLNGAYGLLLTNSTIEASEIAIRNEPPSATGVPNVYMMNCTIKGEISDHVFELSSSSVNTNVDYKPISNRPTIAATALYDLSDYGADATGKTDISAALQKALDDANAAGGGIVYLPAGIYRLTQPVSVGEKTVIMGAHQNPQKGSDAFKGTVLLVTCGEHGDESATAAITVAGNQSGVTGMTVYYPNNGVSSANTLTESPVEYSYFVRCKGNGTFATDLCLIAASRGVCFDGADGFIADRIMMTVYDHGIGVYNARNGAITRIHTNGTYHHIGSKSQTVLHPDWMTDASRVYELIDTHLRPRMTLVKVEGSEDVQLRHVFHYGAKTFLEAASSEVFLLNCESGHISEGKSFLLGGDVWLTGVNFIRENAMKGLEETKPGNVVTVYQYNAAHQPSVIYLN